MRVVVALALMLSACTAPELGPAPVYDPDGGRFYDTPWPSDLRIRPDGTPDMSGVPGSDSLPLLQTYLDIAEAERGYGTTSPIYVPFREPIDTALLPSPHLSTSDMSPVLLIDIDPDSPDWGQRVAFHWQFWEQVTTYLPGNLLAVAPLWGFPLRPNTTYALVVTTDLAASNQRFARVWQDDHPDHALYAPLGDALFFQGLGPSDVAVATVFTTGDPIDEMRRVAAYTQQVLQPPSLSQTLTDLEVDTQRYRSFKGRYQSPVFQHGERPYASEGGGFVFDEQGQPVVHSWDQMRMAVCTPTDLSNPPEGGWPVVMYAHGTFGNYRGYCRGDDDITTAALFAESGFVGIGIDQPLHGTRATEDTNVELHWFNYLNPVAGRTNFRQSAIDSIYLARALASHPIVFTAPDGTEIPLNPDELYFMGHSQGGISGAVALPWMGQDVSTAVLSGAGGGLAITVIERKDPIDISDQIETLGGFQTGETLSELHPITGTVQWLVDPTDPLNYAPYYFHRQGNWATQRPMNVLITSGQLDHATPHRSASAMAAAAHAPQLTPAFDQPPVFGAQQLEGLVPPVAANQAGWDGTPVTSGLSQWAEGDHWVVFDDPAAARMYQRFLVTARDSNQALIEPGE